MKREGEGIGGRGGKGGRGKRIGGRWSAWRMDMEGVGARGGWGRRGDDQKCLSGYCTHPHLLSRESPCWYLHSSQHMTGITMDMATTSNSARANPATPTAVPGSNEVIAGESNAGEGRERGRKGERGGGREVGGRERGREGGRGREGRKRGIKVTYKGGKEGWPVRYKQSTHT